MTDFRGTGMLGLDQLTYITTHHLEETRGMCNDSMVQAHWFFFCVAGINMTKKVRANLKRGFYDVQLLEKWKLGGENTERVSHFIGEEYFKGLQTFTLKWKD